MHPVYDLVRSLYQKTHSQNGCYLFRVEQGDTRDGGPGIFMRHQFVSLESVHTVRVQHTALVHLVLIWLTSSCNTVSRMSAQVCRLTERPGASIQRCLGPLYWAFPPSRVQNSVAERLSVLMPSSSTVTWGALQPRSLLVWTNDAISDACLTQKRTNTHKVLPNFLLSVDILTQSHYLSFLDDVCKLPAPHETIFGRYEKEAVATVERTGCWLHQAHLNMPATCRQSSWS